MKYILTEFQVTEHITEFQVAMMLSGTGGHKGQANLAGASSWREDILGACDIFFLSDQQIKSSCNRLYFTCAWAYMESINIRRYGISIRREDAGCSTLTSTWERTIFVPTSDDSWTAQKFGVNFQACQLIYLINNVNIKSWLSTCLLFW